MKTYLKLVTIVFIGFMMFGCTHDLRITNLDRYQNFEFKQFRNKTIIGIVPELDNIEHKKIVKSFAEGLTKYEAVVILPYNLLNISSVDYITKISINSNYRGSWTNYFIDFPGFLIWTPVWHGYNYTISHNVQIKLISGKTNKEIKQFNIPIELKVKQADSGRTWVQCGWLETGIMPFIGGFFHIQYDDDVTAMVTKEIYYPIGSYVAEEIIDQIMAYENK